MPDFEGFAEPICPDPRNSFHHLDFAVMAFNNTLENLFWWIYFPSPGSTNRICPVSPAENTFV